MTIFKTFFRKRTTCTIFVYLLHSPFHFIFVFLQFYILLYCHLHVFLILFQFYFQIFSHIKCISYIILFHFSTALSFCCPPKNVKGCSGSGIHRSVHTTMSGQYNHVKKEEYPGSNLIRGIHLEWRRYMPTCYDDQRLTRYTRNGGLFFAGNAQVMGSSVIIIA